MPQLSKSTEAARILQTMQALILTSRGIPKKEACETVGLSIWQYDEYIARDSTAIEGLQRSIAEAERIRLSDIVTVQAQLLERLSSNVLSPGYADHDMQLRVLKYLDTLRKELEEKHGVNSSIDDAETYVQLIGPKTRVEDSQMSVKHEMSRATVNIRTRPDGSVDLEIPHQSTIIDLLPGLENLEDSTSDQSQEEES
jgi:hypothetical protein